MYGLIQNFLKNIFEYNKNPCSLYKKRTLTKCDKKFSFFVMIIDDNK